MKDYKNQIEIWAEDLCSRVTTSQLTHEDIVFDVANEFYKNRNVKQSETKRIVVNFKADQRQHDRVQSVAYNNGISKSELVRTAVNDYLNKLEDRPTLAGSAPRLISLANKLIQQVDTAKSINAAPLLDARNELQDVINGIGYV